MTSGNKLHQLKSYTLRLIVLAREIVLKLFHRTDFETIFFEGGLGSQIIAYIDFQTNPRKVDLSYFRNPRLAEKNGPDIWQWELTRYGISLDDFVKFENPKPFNPWITRRPSSIDFSRQIIKNENGARPLFPDYLKSLFPINFEETRKVLEEFKINLTTTITIHIRRGDYERVSSKLVEFSQYAELLESLIKINAFDLLFLSDTEIPQDVKNDLCSKFQKSEIRFLSNSHISANQAHDLMRMSRILITANSTFSISAGLLSEEETIVYSPLRFFGGKDGYLKSLTFNRYGEFFVMRNSLQK